MSLQNIRIVMASPIYGGNVGAVCRAMANMGLTQLSLVTPRPFDENETKMMACHAFHLYEQRREFPSLAEAVADCVLVVGTTARTGLYRQHARPPREWAGPMLEAARSGPVALLFGPEDKGLSNEELAACNHVIQIPTTTEVSSLNVAQAVMVCAYELFIAAGAYEPPREKAPHASAAQKERMFEMWRELLLSIGFMTPEKADHMMLGIRRIFARGALTTDDVRILMGIVRQTEWAVGAGAPARNDGAAPAEPASAEATRS